MKDKVTNAKARRRNPGAAAVQESLFDEPAQPRHLADNAQEPPQESDPPAAITPAAKPGRSVRQQAGGKVRPAPHVAALAELRAALPATLRLGTSSWSYPGWTGLVWERDYADKALSQHGLAAYAQHPLLRAVSIDRTFYKPLEAARLLQYAAQVADDFRFTIKAPSAVTDAMLRNDEGRTLRNNPFFLDADYAVKAFVDPVRQGLAAKLGPLVFQLSPLPPFWLDRIPQLIDRLHVFLRAMPAVRDVAPDGVIAVEVRDRQWLTPAFQQMLREVGATYCLALHARMPRIADQLEVLRKQWPGPLVCRWNLNPLHGAYGYEDAQKKYAPYDKLQDPDLETRTALARLIVAFSAAGQNAFITVSNKSEGCAPLSVIALARAVEALQDTKPTQ